MTTIIRTSRTIKLKFKGLYSNDNEVKFKKDCQVCGLIPDVLAEYRYLNEDGVEELQNNRYFCLKCEVILLRSIGIACPQNLVTAVLYKISDIIRNKSIIKRA